MLDLLTAADLDPVIFYNLRNEFAKILDGSSQQQTLRDRSQRAWAGLDMNDPGVVGDLPIPFPLPERVLHEIEAITEAYPRGFQAGLNRSFRYAPAVRAELARAGLPQDLVWLAMVESQFKTTAVSHAGARGMWQFMPATGKRYGLRIDSYIDERHNWEKATQAAIAYLSDLYQMFGEWPLAVSAYNMGEYGLEKTISYAGGERDLWKILESPAGQETMHRETRKFYPKLVASIIVASSPEKYGFTLAPEPPDDVVRVRVTGSYSLAQLEKAARLPDGTLRALNRDLIRGVTPPSGEFMLAVPAAANAQVIAALKDLPQETRRVRYASNRPAESIRYRVRRGDTLSQIAQRYDVTMAELRRANNLRSADHLVVGKRLTIPGATAPVSRDATVHTVRPGDTLSEIADRYDVAARDLKAWNGLSSSRIRVNQRLQVRAPGASAPASADNKVVHVVRRGESAGAIAAKYNVKLSDLLAWNNLTRRSILRVDQKLDVYAGRPAPPSAAPARTHTVVAGDTLGGLAQKYNVSMRNLMAWNGLTKRSLLRIGDEVVVSGSGATRPAAVRTFKVLPGENPTVIAKKHGVRTVDLLSWNGWSPTKVLHPGDEYVVHLTRSASAEPVVHKVSPGENPTLIAKRYGVQTSDLFAWNGWKQGHVLQVGETVQITR
jgi:membrane-bound lytic murein transglycosylase D